MPSSAGFKAAGEDTLGWIAWAYSWLYLVITAVLILNMLIACVVHRILSPRASHRPTEAFSDRSTRGVKRLHRR